MSLFVRKNLLNFCLRSATAVAALTFLAANVKAQDGKQMFVYPKTEKVEQTDDYHGTRVADPYRWLEDADSPETRAWVQAQNKITFDYLSKIPQREAIKERLTKLWNYEKYTAPFKEGGKYFYFKNNGLQNQSVLYVAESAIDVGRVLLDPNALRSDGTVALSGLAVSPDGRLLAYGLAQAGSDWQEWFVRDIATGKDLQDKLTNIKFSGASWTKDSKGFYYSRFPAAENGKTLQAANYYQKLYYHVVGTPQSEDVLIYERPDDKEMSISGKVTDDGNYLIISVGKGTAPQNMIFFKNLTMQRAPILPLVDKLENDYSFIDNEDSVFYFRTDKNAPLGRVVAVDVAENKPQWKEIVSQADKQNLNSVNYLNRQFVCNYLKDASTQIRIYERDGKLARTVALPGIGTASGFGGKKDETETFYTFLSFNTAPTIYRYDMRTGKSQMLRQAKVDFKSDDYEVNQVFYTSKDGTRVPMFIAHKKGIKLDGANPTLLYSYGGFSISMTPSFSIANLVWMEMGGVYAQPSIRGGSEYGEEWHMAGTKLRKQNVFDDFIAAAEFLIKNKYTQPSKLAITGRSNGGLLIGATLNQRPELFGAAIPEVGVMDMLRFQNFTIGRAWTSDYGSSANADEFKALYAYSPLHNVKAGKPYPAVLITTGDHDDRVVPAHSFKYAATMQEANRNNPRPILIRIETRAGHGAGKPTAKIIEELTDKLAFLVKELNIKTANN
jgi:prolyl oligopeptidase